MRLSGCHATSRVQARSSPAPFWRRHTGYRDCCIVPRAAAPQQALRTPNMRSPNPRAAIAGKNVAMLEAAVLAFTVDCLRRSNDDFLHWQTMSHNEFEQQRCTHCVDRQKAGKIRHVVLICRLVRDHVDTLQRRKENVAIGNVAVDKLCGGGNITRKSRRMNPALKSVEDP